jgi:hypothetical protein
LAKAKAIKIAATGRMTIHFSKRMWARPELTPSAGVRFPAARPGKPTAKPRSMKALAAAIHNSIFRRDPTEPHRRS